MAINWSVYEYNQDGGRNYSATVEEDYLDEATLQEVWQFFLTTVLAENKDLAWDYIRVEFWTDSGHFVILPASLSNENFVERAFAYVIFEQLVEQYERLADSNMDDNQFSVNVAKMVAEWISAAEKAAKSMDLAGIAERDSIRIRFHEAGEVETLRDFYIPG